MCYNKLMYYNFLKPLKDHQEEAKKNPKTVIIIDTIFLFIVIGILVAINVLVIIEMGFNPILILSWILFGGIIFYLSKNIHRASKELKKRRNKKTVD